MMSSTSQESSTRTVLIPVRDVTLAADVTIPQGARGVVLFAHGSGSSRTSPRNRQVARMLNESGFATILLDLLTSEEDALDAVTGELRFDVPKLSLRLADATNWTAEQPETRGLRIGYFGASTGAAAALVAATLGPKLVSAVVSRGGRPDLAGVRLPLVEAPTLLIVGGADRPVIAMNEEAKEKLIRATTQLVIVPGATHLFEEPGALEHVAKLAAQWFEEHLAYGLAPFQHA